MAYKQKIRVPKKTHWINYVVVAGLIAFFLVGFSFYLLPFLRYYQLEQALVAGDPGAIINFIDAAQLKNNISKRQRAFTPGQKVAAQKGPVSLIDLAVKWYQKVSTPDFDRAFTTQGIYAIMGELEKGGPAEEGAMSLMNRVLRNSSFEYHSLDRFSIKVKDLQGRFVGYVTFDFAREGLNWQLVDVQFPLF